MSINNEQKIFLKLISSALSGEPYKIPNLAYDSNLLDLTASNNFCVPFLYHGAVNSSFAFSQNWKFASHYCVIDSYRKLVIESEIIEILRQNGIRSCVLKGSSVAINYPNPLSRPMGDIDLLVDASNYEKASLIFMEEKDYYNNNHEFHVGFAYKNVQIEIHKWFTSVSENSILYPWVSSAMDNIEEKEYENFSIPVLRPSYQAVSLLTHMIRHYCDNEFVFRMFCDWVCFVKSISEDIWKSDVYSAVCSLGLDLFSDALNQSAEIYFGVDMSGKIGEYTHENICGQLMEEFMATDKSNTLNGINKNLAAFFLKNTCQQKNKVSTFFAVVNYIIKNKYRCARHSFLLPFLWVFVSLRYMVNFILGKREKIKHKNIVDEITRRNLIMDTLKMNEVGKNEN